MKKKAIHREATLEQKKEQTDAWMVATDTANIANLAAANAAWKRPDAPSCTVRMLPSV